MKRLTLVDILATQDISEKHAEKLGNDVLNDSFDYAKDPISGIIVNAHQNNPNDFEGMEQDLSYAIAMLQRAKDRIKNRASIVHH